ncbi:Hypothetical protein PHPALM_8068 [Phytophthora palmivora]|uniref:Uncharacterized protein n=1 Tax=Phytophthora palmivora TaxID=4796 RepID=A0A2P4YAQ5_9STRA|nr:Hypothetical protein PHPALM_8068 [Phytophthora palmivora]
MASGGALPAGVEQAIAPVASPSISTAPPVTCYVPLSVASHPSCPWQHVNLSSFGLEIPTKQLREFPRRKHLFIPSATTPSCFNHVVSSFLRTKYSVNSLESNLYRSLYRFFAKIASCSALTFASRAIFTGNTVPLPYITHFNSTLFHGESLTKDKWLSVQRDGTAVAGFPSLRLLHVLSTALIGIGSLPTVGNHVQLLVMDLALVQLIASRRTDVGPDEMPTLVGIVVKVLPAPDASLVDVAYPTAYVGPTPDEAHWQRVQIGNGYVRSFQFTCSLIAPCLRLVSAD